MDAVAETARVTRKQWVASQRRVVDELAEQYGTRDKATRAMHSRFRAMLRGQYGGVLWCHVIAPLGTIPERVLALANAILDEKMWMEAGEEQSGEAVSDSKRPRPRSSLPGPPQGAERPAAPPRGPSHLVSEAKKQRAVVRRLAQGLQEERERIRWDSEAVPPWRMEQLTAKVDRAKRRAVETSERSGNPCIMDGGTVGSTRKVPSRG